MCKSQDTVVHAQDSIKASFLTQRDRVEREVGGGIGMGNTCISKADSCKCMTKTTTTL